jgi:hypothetical protein
VPSARKGYLIIYSKIDIKIKLYLYIKQNMENETKKPKKQLSAKTKQYIKTFMAERYRKNPVYHKKKRGTDNYKNLYDVPQEICDIFAEDLQHIIRINNLVTELNDGSFEHYLMIKNNFNVTKKS